MHCKSLRIEASAKCINVNVNVKQLAGAGQGHRGGLQGRSGDSGGHGRAQEAMADLGAREAHGSTGSPGSQPGAEPGA